MSMSFNGLPSVVTSTRGLYSLSRAFFSVNIIAQGSPRSIASSNLYSARSLRRLRQRSTSACAVGLRCIYRSMVSNATPNSSAAPVFSPCAFLRASSTCSLVSFFFAISHVNSLKFAYLNTGKRRHHTLQRYRDIRWRDFNGSAAAVQVLAGDQFWRRAIKWHKHDIACAAA